MSAFHLGTQNWSYRAWVGPFYPPDTPKADMLQWYGRMFSTLEVDATFYAIPAEPIIGGWLAKVPSDFVFSLKVPQEITHGRRLVGCQATLDKFVDRVRQLGNSLGPMLVQLPPDFVPTPETRLALRNFVARLPRNHRWAVEFRHPGWLDQQTLTTLRDHNVALTLVDGRWVRRSRMLEAAAEPTADFSYVRWMGSDVRFTNFSHPQRDCESELAIWADTLKLLAESAETVYGYFNNQYQGHSPHSVRAMQRLLGQAFVEPMAIRTQTQFFSFRNAT
ncbi:MAG: DUF72 domain-containing protein [Gemmatimonadetes bacterium]|nr:DUF72 domain-containing protein [Gemmatimonadota bacterium]MCH7715556.1 DUF72 domain-containing protein [Gemmatimonadota bacterium]